MTHDSGLTNFLSISVQEFTVTIKPFNDRTYTPLRKAADTSHSILPQEL